MLRIAAFASSVVASIPDRRALKHARRDEALLHPGEHGAMRLDVNQSPGSGDRRVVRHILVHGDAQEAPNRQRVRRAPGDAPLRVNAFKVPHQQRAKVDARRETWPATGGGVEPLALPFDKRIETVGVQQGVHSTIERVGDRLGQVGRRDPEGFLSSSFASCAH